MFVSHSTRQTGIVQIAAIPEPSAVLPPDGVHLLRANNPGLLSLTGTNTWVLAGRVANAAIVIDPGPPLDEHLVAIRALGRPAAIVLTHHHIDHSEAAPVLAAEFDAPVYAALPELAVGTAPLTEGDVIDAAGWRLTVLATPGHTSDSVCIAIGGALFTGDTLLGGSTTIIAPPTGSLAEYFATMARLSELVDTPGFPGHGPAFSSVGAWATHNAEYREQRLAQLTRVYTELAAEANGAPSLSRVASATYGENGEPVAQYVEAMTDAQLQFLAERGDIAGWG
jgi:glyoxylase-like metal-dependent hydrolase (beta-lactamase superfamily II)